MRRQVVFPSLSDLRKVGSQIIDFLNLAYFWNEIKYNHLTESVKKIKEK